MNGSGFRGSELSEHRARAFGLQGLIETFVCSGFVHVRKSDADIFRIAIDLAQVEPTEVVYLATFLGPAR